MTLVPYLGLTPVRVCSCLSYGYRPIFCLWIVSVYILLGVGDWKRFPCRSSVVLGRSSCKVLVAWCLSRKMNAVLCSTWSSWM
ncbi:unnamed protein product [Amoebophrya sp. A25]|nr:unnamed protein product [Amoebophrya sp. A25]|eukprot:GSA25T00017792001.1